MIVDILAWPASILYRQREEEGKSDTDRDEDGSSESLSGPEEESDGEESKNLFIGVNICLQLLHILQCLII